jgi:hypothetical protein
MSIEHKNIPEDGLHEPKGASTAASDRVYVSDGEGSGSWGKVSSGVLQGTVSSSEAGLRVVTDGAGGFDTEPTPGSAFGTMNLTDNSATQTLTAATDSDLNTDSDFEEISIALDFENVQGMVSGSNYLEIVEPGLYLIDFWANVSSSTASTRWSLKFVKNDSVFVPRGPKLWLNSSNEFYNSSANGIHEFEAGDQIKLFMASDKSVDITIEDMTFQMVYVGSFS